MTHTLHLGDCLGVLQFYPDNHFHSIVTDPPYGLSFMGKKWDYDVPSVEIWTECLRVLKPGGHLLSFSSARTYHRMVVNVEDAGFEIRDQIMWVYGSGFPKSHNIGKSVDKLQGNEREVVGERKQSGAKFKTWSDDPNETRWHNQGFNDQSRTAFDLTKGNSDWEGWGTALKPAHEPIVMARKPISEKNIAENVLKWGTGGLNIDKSRVGDEERTYDLTMTPGNFETTNGGKNKKSGTATVTGRFPANFIHDGSQQVLDLFPSQSGANRTQAQSFFYCAKASKKERGVGNNHPTIKPQALMSYLINLVTPPGGLVLDPFMGSGSTGVAAVSNDYSFIGVELDKDYLEIARCRLTTPLHTD